MLCHLNNWDPIHSVADYIYKYISMIDDQSTKIIDSDSSKKHLLSFLAKWLTNFTSSYYLCFIQYDYTGIISR